MTINDEITIIANQLANQGKKPTVALIKTRLNKTVALPQIISTLKNWRHEPEKIILPVAKTSSNEQQHKSISTELEIAITQALAPVKAELAEIKSLLKEIQDKRH